MKSAGTNLAFYALVTCGVLALCISGIGCGSNSCTEADPTGYVNVAVSVEGWLTGNFSPLAPGPVDFGDIASLLVTIERITLNASSEDDSLGGVVVFDAAVEPTVDNEVDLVDLSELSDLVASAPVPVGVYQQVRLEIDEPRLRLVGDPEGEYRTNIQRTANGRLFAAVEIALETEETLDLTLVLNDLHLVEKGNGDFVLTPQLRVDIVSGD